MASQRSTAPAAPAAASAAPFTRPRRIRARQDPTTDYATLLAVVRDAGLLERRRGFYAAMIAGLSVALVSLISSVSVVGDSWWQLVNAAILGLVLAQFGFIAHEAAHREVAASGRWNDAIGRVIADLVAGISYSGWKTGHNRHHANPNLMGKDPSVKKGVFAYTSVDAASRRSTGSRWYTRRQGWFFFPMLLAAGLGLYISGFRAVLGREHVDRRGTEVAFLLVRNVGYLAGVFAFLPAGKACAFVAVQLAVFGVALSSAFVPNHIGMPVLPEGTRTDFLRRQVLTSRNIRGGWAVTAWMGGLDFQIEHHLFPNMPRPALRPASRLVKAFCDERGIPYTEAHLFDAYVEIAIHLNEVGRAGLQNPFECPVAGRFGR
jgi:fatty acid desaturase